MNHPSKTRLGEYLNELLDDAQDRTVARHLEECRSCQSAVEEIIGSKFTSLLSGDNSPLSQSYAPRRSNKSDSNRLPQFMAGSRFLILEELARGGMGIVYRGFDRHLKCEVAIKVSKGDGRDAASVRFHREAEIAGQLQHPGIIPVYEFGQLLDGRFYIAMKLVEGQTLLAFIRSDRKNLTKHLDVFGSVCETMAYAHARDVIHRDLKPDNVMVGTFGEVQVMDWGLGRKLKKHSSTDETSIGQGSPQNGLLPGSTRVGEVFGTPAYIAPEQARGDRADKRADVFAMGGILYEILTGKPPFDASTATAAMQQSVAYDLGAAMRLLEKTTADAKLVRLVKACLAADPNDRPADAQKVTQFLLGIKKTTSGGP